MGQIKWYKRDPSAALNGMMELSLEERGAYNTVLDLIYSRDGNLADDDRFIAGWLRVDIRVWKRIKTALITRRKLFVEGGILHNARADVEVLAALSRVTSAQEAGLASARSKARKSGSENSETNDLASTTVATGVPTTVSTNHNHNQNREEEGKPSPSPARAKKQDDPFPKPDWADPQVWIDFLQNRRRKRCSNTVTAYRQFLADVDRLASDEWPPGRLLRHATAKGWGGIYDPTETRHDREQYSQPARPSTRDLGRKIAEEFERQADDDRDGGVVDFVPRLGAPRRP